MKKVVYFIVASVSLSGCLMQAMDNNRLVREERTFTENLVQKAKGVGHFALAGLHGYGLVKLVEPVCKHVLLPMAGIACVEGTKTCVLYGGPILLTAGIAAVLPVYWGLKQIDKGVEAFKK